jgi:hypothetical protein
MVCHNRSLECNTKYVTIKSTKIRMLQCVCGMSNIFCGMSKERNGYAKEVQRCSMSKFLLVWVKNGYAMIVPRMNAQRKKSETPKQMSAPCNPHSPTLILPNSPPCPPCHIHLPPQTHKPFPPANLRQKNGPQRQREFVRCDGGRDTHCRHSLKRHFPNSPALVPGNEKINCVFY